MVRCLHPASRNLSTRPSDSKICSDRGCTTVARSQCIGAERASIRWHGTPRRCSSEASSRPVGPAPTTSTAARCPGSASTAPPTRCLGILVDSWTEPATVLLHFGNVAILARGSLCRGTKGLVYSEIFRLDERPGSGLSYASEYEVLDEFQRHSSHFNSAGADRPAQPRLPHRPAHQGPLQRRARFQGRHAVPGPAQAKKRGPGRILRGGGAGPPPPILSHHQIRPRGVNQ